MEVLEHIIRANEVYITTKVTYEVFLHNVNERMNLQRAAMSRLKVLSNIAELACNQKCILPKQFAQITKQIHNTQNLLGAWLSKDRERFIDMMNKKYRNKRNEQTKQANQNKQVK